MGRVTPSRHLYEFLNSSYHHFGWSTNPFSKIKHCLDGYRSAHLHRRWHLSGRLVERHCASGYLYGGSQYARAPRNGSHAPTLCYRVGIHLIRTEVNQAKLETDAAQSMHYAAQAERFRIARDIHDGLGHQLTSLIVQLQALSYMIPESLTEVRSHVPKLLEVARAGLAEVRQSVRDWEEADNSYGLAALTAVVEEIKSTTHCNIDFQTAVDEHEGWPASVQIVLYRVLQETLANTVRHSNARHIAVRLIENNQQVKMIVADNGSIATQTELHPGFGLRNMKTRCEEIGGSCRWEVLQEGGVSVEVVLPLVDTS